MSYIEERVVKQIQDRAATGEKKYGVTMAREDLSFPEWLQHLQEELLDAAVYVEKLKEGYEKITEAGKDSTGIEDTSEESK